MLDLEKIMKEIEQLLKRLPITQLQCHIKIVCDDIDIYVNGFTGEILDYSNEDVDAIIRITEQDLLSILKGEVNAVGLFTSGKIQVEGDMTVAFKLKDIFG